MTVTNKNSPGDTNYDVILARESVVVCEYNVVCQMYTAKSCRLDRKKHTYLFLDQWGSVTVRGVLY